MSAFKIPFENGNGKRYCQQHDDSNKYTDMKSMIILLLVFLTGFIVGNSNLTDIINILASPNHHSPSSVNYDIIIVGGGATGIIQMHFLTKFYPNLNILLIEKQPQIGGRTISSKITHYAENNSILSTSIMEGGALRTAYNHLLWKILYYLDLCDDIIPFQSSIKPIDYYRRYRFDQNNVEWNKVYHLTDRDHKYIDNNPNIFNETYWKILNENNNGKQPQTEKEWNQFFSIWTINNVPVYKYSIRSYLRIIANVSIEFDEYITDTSTWWSKQGNLAGYLWFLYGFDQYQNTTTINQSYINMGIVTLKNGYQSMINQFYDKMSENTKKNNVLLNTELMGINYNHDNQYKYKVLLRNHTQNFSFYAENVILSIPPMNLRKLVPYIAPIDNVKMNYLLNTVIPRHMYRINLIYDSSFWINEAIYKLTQSHTNLEINELLIENMWTNNTLTTISVYPKSTERSDFWNELQILGQPFQVNQNIKIDNVNGLIIASDIVVFEVIKQLEILINDTKSIPLPLAAFVYPFGKNESYLDGLNNFKYDVKNIKNISDELNKPNRTENIFIAVSDFDQNLISSQYAAFGEGLKNIQKQFNIPNQFHDSKQCPPPKWSI